MRAFSPAFFFCGSWARGRHQSLFVKEFTEALIWTANPGRPDASQACAVFAELMPVTSAGGLGLACSPEPPRPGGTPAWAGSGCLSPRASAKSLLSSSGGGTPC